MQDLHFSIYIAGTPAAVWDAITKPEGVAKIYYGSRLETSFAIGSPYRYIGADDKGNDVVHVEGEVLACKPHELLQLNMRAGPMWQKGPHVYSSRLAYKIEALPFATKLSVVHDQWQEGDPGHASNRDGWMVLLSSIKSYIETGKPLELPKH